jgi:hypothetical protein
MSHPRPDSIETTEQLRISLDRGLGGDKVDAPDPAAAPLGTDDEAGGHTNTPSQVRFAASHELTRSPKQKQKQQKNGLGHAWFLIIYTGLTGAAIVIGFLSLERMVD